MDWAHIRRVVSITGWAMTVTALIVAWSIGVPRLQAYAARDTVAPSQTQLIFVDPPAWFRGDLRESLTRNVLDRVTGAPLDRQQLVDIREMLLHSGWFADVEQVRLRRAGVIEIDAEFFVPFATIEDMGGHHVVDATGRLLPLTYEPRDDHDFPVIQRQRLPRPAQPGVRWPGEDVVAALKLLRLIDPAAWRHQVRAVDLRRFADTRTLLLISTRGCRIIWGSPPGEEQALEAFADLKMRYLKHHFKEFGHIDGGYTPAIDVTGTEGVMVIENTRLQ